MTKTSSLHNSNGHSRSRKRNRYNNFQDDEDEEEDVEDDDDENDKDEEQNGHDKTTKRTRSEENSVGGQGGNDLQVEEYNDDGDNDGRRTPTLGNATNRMQVEEEMERGTTTASSTVAAVASMPWMQQSQQELTQQLEDSSSCSPCLPAATPSLLLSAAERAAQLRQIPWGRLVPRGSGGGAGMELLPKSPLQETSRGGDDKERLEWFLGLPQLHPRDRFNEYTLGRSAKCDVVVPKLEDKKKKKDDDNEDNDDWVSPQLAQNIHSIVSNRHASIFCLLGGKAHEMEVYVEDQSGNGTLINGTTLLRRGERRLLHTGDEVGLLNPAALRKHKCPLPHQEAVLSHYSYVFVNLYTSQQQQQQQQHEEMPPPSASSSSSAAGVTRGATPAVATILTNPAMAAAAAAQRGGQPPPSSPSSCSERQEQRRRSVEEDYDLRNVLGTGTCGEVRRAIHRRSGVERAVKIIATTATKPFQAAAARRRQLQWQSSSSGGSDKNGSGKASKESLFLDSDGPLWESDHAILAEAELLQSLQHPYIVNLVNVYVKPGVAVYLVMELMEGGDLFDRIVAKGRYTEVETRRVLRRLLSAVYYLHEQCDICHRDLKPENILCVSKDNDVQVKLTDFGLAKVVTEQGLKTFCGTPLYFAPEVLRRRHTVAGRGRYGREADMWSLGIITYILLSGTPPFDPDEQPDEHDQEITFPLSTWNHVSPQAIAFVQGLLRTNPEERFTARSASSDEWILTPDGDTHEYPLADPALPLPLQKTMPEPEDSSSSSFGTNRQRRQRQQRLPQEHTHK